MRYWWRLLRTQQQHPFFLFSLNIHTYSIDIIAELVKLYSFPFDSIYYTQPITYSLFVMCASVCQENKICCCWSSILYYTHKENLLYSIPCVLYIYVYWMVAFLRMHCCISKRYFYSLYRFSTFFLLYLPYMWSTCLSVYYMILKEKMYWVGGLYTLHTIHIPHIYPSYMAIFAMLIVTRIWYVYVEHIGACCCLLFGFKLLHFFIVNSVWLCFFMVIRLTSLWLHINSTWLYSVWKAEEKRFHHDMNMWYIEGGIFYLWI